jgi:predicted metalloendopeptidase
MVQTAVFMGAEEEVAKVEMKEALELELKLAEMALPREERRNKTALYNPRTLMMVQQLYPEIPIIEYVNKIHGSDNVAYDEEEVVNVNVPKYITGFREHISKVSNRVQANYLIWRIVQDSMRYLNEEALEIQLAFNKVITGKATKSPRWEKCAKSTAGLREPNLYFKEGSLTNAVGGMYAKKHFQLDAKEKADEILDNVRTEFKKMLDELNWMDATTKAKAHTKVDQITPHMAYAKEILDDNLINEFYSGLNLEKDRYLKNILRLKRFINAYYISEFRNPIDKQSWKTHGGAAIVNAFYSPEENSIQFPAGILGGVFFQKDRPLYMNYGAIGFVVGHEITHGFDDEGSQTDGEGNLVDWWEPETKQKYLEKAQCIIDQYGNYTVEVDGEILNVNGITTQGENIADNGGVKEAFRAYDSVVRQYGPEPILPGLEYTP